MKAQQQQQQQQQPSFLFESATSAADREARILTWNINGLRKVAADHGGIKPLLDQFNADIVCFQEIKITRAGLVEHDLARAKGYHGFFNHCKVHRKVSYSGVATFVRAASETGLKTLAATTSLGDSAFFCSPGGFVIDGVGLGLSPDRMAALDSEGRVVVTDHGHFVLFNVYAPCISSGDEDEKTEDRREFKRDFLAALEARVFQIRECGRRVVLVGDLNACASQRDHGFTMTDAQFYASNWSKWIRGMLGMDSPEPPRLVDCFRRRHPERKNAFTCWNTQTGARENNYGTRIDYIIADATFADRSLRGCDILPDFMGSDHCPVRATFGLPTPGQVLQEGVSRASGRVLGGDGEVAASTSNEGEWPEHPPECSCFYRELRAKQEKLARYFVAGGHPQQAPNVDSPRDGGRETLVAEEMSAKSCGRPGSVSLPAAAGTRTGTGPFVRHSPREVVTSTIARGPANRMSVGGSAERGQRALGRGSSTSRSSMTRTPASGKSRQTKLTFGAAAGSVSAGDGVGGDRGVGSDIPVATTGAGTELHATAPREAMTDADRTAAVAEGRIAVRATATAQASSRTDRDRGREGDTLSAADTTDTGMGGAFYTTKVVQSRLEAGTSGDDSVGDGGQGALPDRGLKNVFGTACINKRSGSRSSSGDARGVGAGSAEGSSNSDSAAAWKTLFSQRKSAPPCEHGEPSIQRTVLKPGPNCNRRFYTCARSAGNWPTDRNARCNFFQWRRDGVRGYKDRPTRDERSTNKKRRV